MTITLAGSGGFGYNGGGFADGAVLEAMFKFPIGIDVDKDGNIYVVDNQNHRIRKITPDGNVITFAGNGDYGFADGSGESAMFNFPQGLTVDNDGNVYVADFRNHRIRKITPDGNVITFAGSESYGYENGKGAEAIFMNPTDLVIDSKGNLYVAGWNDQTIRKIAPDGNVTIFAGRPRGYGDIDGNGEGAMFSCPKGIAIDKDDNLYVSDSWNHKIKKIIQDGTVTTIAGKGGAGFADGEGRDAIFDDPSGIDVHSNGIIYVADRNNQRIRKITQDGVVTTLAGTNDYGYVDGEGSEALFNDPTGIAVNGNGSVYITDTSNHRIRKL